MLSEENNTNDIIMDLNIPFTAYLCLILIIIVIVLCKYFFSSEELFEFIEKSKKSSLKLFSDENDKLKLLTELNTKINRDHLDNSKYYNEVGYTKIYGKKKDKQSSDINEKLINKDIEKKNRNKIFIKKNKKVCFSDNITYENETENDNENKY